MADKQSVIDVAEQVVFETDWLASQSFFYNVRTGAASGNINEVIDFANLEIDAEGFNDYLDFGFSVFERTPVRDVHVLRYCARLISGPDGLRVEYLDDPADDWYERRSSVDAVLDAVDEHVNAAAGPGDEDIVVPTSGGFDSRLINLVLHDHSRVRAFTYGLSDDPVRSVEVVKACELARRLGIRWEPVALGDFHQYLDEWDAQYGVSMHAHGMYQMEFYRLVAQRVAAARPLISGICGEWFSGDDHEVRALDTLTSPDDFYTIFVVGGLHADSAMSRLTSRRVGAQRLFDEAPRLRREILPRVTAVVRIDMMYLSYLLSVPEALGFLPKAPYLHPDVALRLLTLPDEIRRERKWERAVFAHYGVDLESANLRYDPRNTLNFTGMRRVPLKPLDENVLREVVRPEYVRWINRSVGMRGLPWELYWRLNWRRGFRRAVGLLNRAGLEDQRLPAYGAYLTLWPIETLLRRRDLARQAGADR